MSALAEAFLINIHYLEVWGTLFQSQNIATLFQAVGVPCGPLARAAKFVTGVVDGTVNPAHLLYQTKKAHIYSVLRRRLQLWTDSMRRNGAMGWPQLTDPSAFEDELRAKAPSTTSAPLQPISVNVPRSRKLKGEVNDKPSTSKFQAKIVARPQQMKPEILPISKTLPAVKVKPRLVTASTQHRVDALQQAAAQARYSDEGEDASEDDIDLMSFDPPLVQDDDVKESHEETAPVVAEESFPEAEYDTIALFGESDDSEARVEVCNNGGEEATADSNDNSMDVDSSESPRSSKRKRLSEVERLEV